MLVVSLNGVVGPNKHGELFLYRTVRLNPWVKPLGGGGGLSDDPFTYQIFAL